jgi:hypothetical protein
MGTGVPKVVLAVAIAIVAASCSESTDPTSPPTQQTQTFNGSTRVVGSGCTSDSHDFDTLEGQVTMRLDQSPEAPSLRVQVCAGGIDNNNCTVNLQRIDAGQTISGARRGGVRQNLKFLPLDCAASAPPGPFTYRATVTYFR